MWTDRPMCYLSPPNLQWIFTCFTAKNIIKNSKAIFVASCQLLLAYLIFFLKSKHPGNFGDTVRLVEWDTADAVLIWPLLRSPLIAWQGPGWGWCRCQGLGGPSISCSLGLLQCRLKIMDMEMSNSSSTELSLDPWFGCPSDMVLLRATFSNARSRSHFEVWTRQYIG